MTPVRTATALLIAPDSFKGTHTAAEVSAALARGAGAVVSAHVCPIADGGEGTVAAVLGAGAGEIVEHPAHDALGRPLRASFAMLDDGSSALVEVAAASGLAAIAEGERDALGASSAGTGELIAAAAARGARVVVVAAGGSASSDGGRGAIEAIERAGGLGGARLLVLADVTTTFERAAEVFGPQKGADEDTVRRLARRLDGYASELPRDPRGLAMGGAAGGLAGGLWASYGAELVAGADWVLDRVGFDSRLAAARWAVTGEGRIDSQTLAGKAVAAVAARCSRAGVTLHAVTGACELDGEQCSKLGIESVRIASTLDELEHAGRRLAEELS